MLRNMVFIMFIGFFLAGCAGFMPAESFDEYRARVGEPSAEQYRFPETSYDEVKKRTPQRSQLTQFPNSGVLYNSGHGLGVEAHNSESPWRSKTTITPFAFGRNPHYNRGIRQEKRRMENFQKQEERRLAVDLARQDALSGGMNLQGVPSKYLWLYEREFERNKESLNRRSYDQYRRNEYRRGQEDFRQEHSQW